MRQYEVLRALLKNSRPDDEAVHEILQAVFQTHRTVFVRENPDGSVFVRTVMNAILFMSGEAYRLLSEFDGGHSLVAISNRLRPSHVWIEQVNIECNPSDRRNNYRLTLTFNHPVWDAIVFVCLCQELSLLQCVGTTFDLVPEPLLFPETPYRLSAPQFTMLEPRQHEPVDILLLGDKPGVSSVGLLYLASYLKRHGIRAVCLYVSRCWNNDDLDRQMRTLLRTLRPVAVGISMKWFAHISRALTLAQIVKKHDASIQTILGGDTASYFAEELAASYPQIDYLVCGDGEKPLLKLCRERFKPLGVWQKGGANTRILKPQANDASSPIFLEDLSQIELQPGNLLLDTLYIPTHKGCRYDCIQCGGNRTLQSAVYKRKSPCFSRAPKQVHHDIAVASAYASAFMFSVGNAEVENATYFRQAFDGLSLKNHFCAFFGINVLDEAIVHLACNSFQFVRFSVDICSLSQSHRMRLASLGYVKPQPNDEELYRFFDLCAHYENCGIDIYSIAGMPDYTSADMEAANAFCDEIRRRFPVVTGIQWGRLHAQPGARIAADAQAFGMKSEAATFSDYLRYSESHMKLKTYPALAFYNYPFLSYQDKDRNIHVLNHYVDLSNQFDRTRRPLIEEALSFGCTVPCNYPG